MENDLFRDRLFEGIEYTDQNEAFQKNTQLIKTLKYFEIINISVVVGCVIGLIINFVMIGNTGDCGSANELGVPFLFCILIILLFTVLNSYQTKTEKGIFQKIGIGSFILGILMNIAFTIYFLIRKELNFGNCYITSAQSGLLTSFNIITLVLMIVLVQLGRQLKKLILARGVAKHLSFFKVLAY